MTGARSCDEDDSADEGILSPKGPPPETGMPVGRQQESRRDARSNEYVYCRYLLDREWVEVRIPPFPPASPRGLRPPPGPWADYFCTD